MNFLKNILSLINKGSLSLIFLLAVLITACNENRISVSAFSKSPEKQLINKAGRISIEREKGYLKVTIIDPWQGAEKISMVYYLVRRGSVLPPGVDSSNVIFTPLKNIICMSTTHIAMISALGEQNSVIGVSGPEYVYSESVRKIIENNLVADVGYEANLNKELILSIDPELIMMYGIGSESAGYIGKIKELGVKVMFNADYLETDPLGRSEWIKLFGALYCKEEMADSIFNSEFKVYDSLKLYIEKNISSRPKVLLGLPYKDTWFISPGNSFISRIISDAGGEYLWKDTESAISMPYGIENVYLRALNADYWINIGSIRTKNEILAVDSRLVQLPSYINNNLYNNNRRITLKGGNDYWESGSVYPHLILRDIATILHSELFIDSSLSFYRKIE